MITARQSLEVKVVGPPGSTLLHCCGQKWSRGQSVLQKRPWHAAQNKPQTTGRGEEEGEAAEALNVFSWTVPRSASAASCPHLLHQELQQLHSSSRGFSLLGALFETARGGHHGAVLQGFNTLRVDKSVDVRCP